MRIVASTASVLEEPTRENEEPILINLALKYSKDSLGTLY
jgi:hypothetical protein